MLSRKFEVTPIVSVHRWEKVSTAPAATPATWPSTCRRLGRPPSVRAGPHPGAVTHPPHDGCSHRTDDQRTPPHRPVLAIVTVVGGVSMTISNLRSRKFSEIPCVSYSARSNGQSKHGAGPLLRRRCTPLGRARLLGDPGAAEAVGADLGRQPRLSGAALYHLQRTQARHRPILERIAPPGSQLRNRGPRRSSPMPAAGRSVRIPGHLLQHTSNAVDRVNLRYSSAIARAMAAPIRSAVASMSLSAKCAYRNVIRTLLWPSSRETTGTGTSFMTAWLARLWRRS